jgi:hypothetical protein
MASRMAMSYKPQIAQVNEQPTPELFLNLTLTQHLHDENPKQQEMHTRFEVNPLQAWYYHIFPNSHTIVIML